MKINQDIIDRIKELNPSVLIRKATEYDVDKFVNLFNSYYKRKTNPEYFFWQFFKSPFSSALFMAFDGESLVGYYGIKIYPLTNDLVTGFAIDLLIDERYRKKGIAYLLDEQVTKYCRENNADGITALPNNFGKDAFTVLGFNCIKKINTLILNINKSTKVILDNHINDNNEISCVQFEKNDIYRKWRFNNNPLYKYKYVQLDSDCFAITKIFKDPNSNASYGDIVDIQSNSISQSLLLIQKVIKEMIDDEIETVTVWSLEHSPLHNVLINNGFINIEQERYFCIKPLKSAFQSLTNIANWNLVQADAEIY